MDVDPATSARMARVRSKDTAIEMALRRELHRRGRRFFVHRRVLADRRSVDIVFPRARLAVFVDGCFWHSCPLHATRSRTNTDWWEAKLAANQERDRHTNEDLVAAGWEVLRFWEHTHAEDAAECIEVKLDEIAAGAREHDESE